MPDREKIIEGLKELQSHFHAMAGIASSRQGRANHMESARTIGDAIALLDAQKEIVHCRDCKFAHLTYSGECKYCDKISMPDDEGDYGGALYLPGEFYCACGERR